jgi:hypothetical protein
MTTCRWCGASIVDALTLGGKRIALDASPSPDGTWALSPESIAEDVGPSWIERRGVKNLHTEHYAACPGAIGKKP